MEKTSGEHLGAPRENLGWFCESFGNHLRVIEAPKRHPDRPRPPRRLQEVLDSKSDAPLS